MTHDAVRSDTDNRREPAGTGVREILRISGPIVLGMLSYTVMGFMDRVMIGWLRSEDALAAVGSADIAAYTLSTLAMGFTSMTTAFVAQCYGQGNRLGCTRYTWQGIHLSLMAVVLAAMLYPCTAPLFDSMGHSPAVAALEKDYFRIRLYGYYFVSLIAALSGFFQGIGRPAVTMYAALLGNAVNLILNYLLIFGKCGFPVMGIRGAAFATVTATAVQALFLMAIFLSRSARTAYGTHRSWKLNLPMCREIIRVGAPAALAMFLDVANWWIWISYIIGRFGPVQMAANTIAVSFNSITFMPVIGIHQGIAAIVGQWIGRGNRYLARSRAWTAVRLSVAYMVIMGILIAAFGGVLTWLLFRPDNAEVVRLAHRLLILAAFFQAFDAINITLSGALRGAGDTRWIMWTTALLAYGFGLPLSAGLSIGLGLETFGAWIGATIFIMTLSAAIILRFHGGRWEKINLFSETRYNQNPQP